MKIRDENVAPLVNALAFRSAEARQPSLQLTLRVRVHVHVVRPDIGDVQEVLILGVGSHP